jgi:hypothetical protein
MTHVRINRSVTKWPAILCTWLSFSQFIVLLSSSCGFPLHPSPSIRQEILREPNVDQRLTSAQLFLMDRSSFQWPLTLPAQPRALRKFLTSCQGHAIPAEDAVYITATFPVLRLPVFWSILSSSTLPQNLLELRGCHISLNQFWRSLPAPGCCWELTATVKTLLAQILWSRNFQTFGSCPSVHCFENCPCSL